MKIGMIKEDLDGQQWYNEDYVNEMMSRSYWEGGISFKKFCDRNGYNYRELLQQETLNFDNYSNIRNSDAFTELDL